MKFTPPLSTPLADPAVEAARRNTDQRVLELQSLVSVGLTVIPGVVLADGVDTSVAHRLGRRPMFVTTSAVRGSGFTVGVVRDRGEETGSGLPIDRTKAVVLQALGFTVPITVDVVLC